MIPTPKKLEKALKESAQQARRFAEEFGKTIPRDAAAQTRQSV
jgi:hypothetical protein